MGKISFALSRAPFENYLNSASDRCIDDERLSKFDGMCV